MTFELRTSTEVHMGVKALIAERLESRPTRLAERHRLDGEINALDAVLRLIETGDWQTPPRPRPSRCRCGTCTLLPPHPTSHQGP